MKRATTPRRRKGEKVLPAVRPNCGLEAAYRRKLYCLVEEMHNSVNYWISAKFKSTPPAMAMDDATAASQLRIAINKLTRQWGRRFDVAAKELAAYFALDASKRSDAALRAILKKGGWSVRFTMTPAMQDIFKATVAENVALIRSIPNQYLTQVQGHVMRSVAAGRDLGTVAKELERQYGVTRRRAANIARSQNNLAASAFHRARELELGLKAKWLHSGGSRHPRPK